jgi:hypothetical protein
MYLKRTLETKGTKHVYGVVNSAASTTHTYTVMPIISMSGKLGSKMLIILQEPTTPSENVKNKMFKAENLYITHSKSGKIDKNIANDFIKNVFLPDSGARNLLLLDACSSHKGEEILKLVTSPAYEKEKLKIMHIPAGCTSMLQPLDVYFFRGYKSACLHIARQAPPEMKMFQRDHILKFQSLMYHQAQSPRFKDCYNYAWAKSGYCKRPRRFIGFREFTTTDLSHCIKCNNYSVFRCAYCKDYLCFDHFYIDYHFCKNYVE